MSRYWSRLVASLDPYVPGEQPQDQRYIKLNTNESPYPPAPAVTAVLRNSMPTACGVIPTRKAATWLPRWPATTASRGTQVFVGNGSDEVLAHAFQAFFKQPEPILFPDISYSFYPVYALYEIEYDRVALDEDFRIDFAGYRRGNGGIILPNPNAPTGIAIGLAEIRELLADNPESVIVIDEAYVDFGTDSACELIAEFDNLLVIRTYLSRNLAGIRLGYAHSATPT